MMLEMIGWKRKLQSHFRELFYYHYILMSLVDSRVMRINIDHSDQQNLSTMNTENCTN